LAERTGIVKHFESALMGAQEEGLKQISLGLQNLKYYPALLAEHVYGLVNALMMILIGFWRIPCSLMRR